MTDQHTLYFNGPILSMDAHNATPEAVLTRAETILSVGDLDDLRGKMPVGAVEVDLRGRTLIPAFIDPHGHFPDSGFIRLFRVNLSTPPLGDCTDIATALQRLRERAAKMPKGEWVMGVLFDHTAVPGGKMPTRDELDSVSTDHPVWIIHTSGHSGAANSMALQLQGLNRDTVDPLGGRYGRDPVTGRLTGVIEGISAMGPMGDTIFEIDHDKFWAGFDACRDEYLEYGVTYGQNAWTSRDMLELFASQPKDRDPGFDLVLLPVGEQEPEMTQGPNAVAWPENPHFTLGPRKLFTDGALQLQTAFLSKPYHKPANLSTPCGMSYASEDEHRFQVKKLHDLGHQIHCHCNGDAGADMFISAVDAALTDNPRADHRHTIIHGQTLRDDQLERMAKLGITVSFFSAHVHFWGDSHYETLLGPDRAERISPAASAERYGVRYTIHNDASVTPTRPIHLAHCAVNRLTASGRHLGKDQEISVLSALKAQTIDAAWQVFQEDIRGSIEPGKLADFAILSRDPRLNPDQIFDVKVEETIRRGVSVFTLPATT